MPIERLGAVTGETYYASLGFEGFLDAVTGPRGFLSRKAARANVRLPDLGEVSDLPAISVHLGRDQWRVACPDCVRDFQIAWSTVRLFMCSSCWNHAAGGLWRRVAWPDEREAIEGALVGVAPSERSWLPGWSVERATLEAGNERAVSPAEMRAALRGEPAREPVVPVAPRQGKADPAGTLLAAPGGVVA